MGLLQPATHHLYDMELGGADVVPKPKDGGGGVLSLGRGGDRGGAQRGTGQAE